MNRKFDLINLIDSSSDPDEVNKIRNAFNNLLVEIESNSTEDNRREIALAGTKLEEACFYAIKAISFKYINN